MSRSTAFLSLIPNFHYDGGWDLLVSFSNVILMANTPWDPSQATFHLHGTEEEEEVD